MKKITTITAILIAAIITTAGVTFETGIAGRTNSPGETNCSVSGCHNDFTLNSGPGSITITSSNLTNWSYKPDSTYQVTVTVSQTGQPLFGFDFEALKLGDTTSAGIIAVTNSDSQIMTKTVSGKVRVNITHTQNGGLTNNSHSFTFNWTAPATDSGNVEFYAAGVAADNSGDPTGDYVYTTTQLVSSPTTVGIHDMMTSGSFSIYPNPIHHDCNIQFKSVVKNGKCDVQLYNLTGSLVQSESNVQISQSGIMGFNIADNVASGVYLMKLIVNGNISTQKVIVSKD